MDLVDCCSLELRPWHAFLPGSVSLTLQVVLASAGLQLVVADYVVDSVAVVVDDAVAAGLVCVVGGAVPPVEIVSAAEPLFADIVAVNSADLLFGVVDAAAVW